MPVRRKSWDSLGLIRENSRLPRRAWFANMRSVKILSFAHNLALGDSRRCLLEAAGYDVQTASSVQEARRMLEAKRFHLVIVGHAVPHPDDQTIATAAQQAHVPTLFLYSESGQASSADSSRYFSVKEGATGLLKVIQEICGTRDLPS